MNRKSNQAALGLGAIVVSLTSIQALATQGPYVGGEGGINLAGKQTYFDNGSYTTTAQPPEPVEEQQMPNSGAADAIYKYKISPMFGWTGGYSFSNGLRPEFELSFREDKPKSIGFGSATTSANSSPSSTGSTELSKLHTTAVFGNLWYDFFPSWSLHPYAGAGVGVARFKISHLQDNLTPTTENTDTSTAGLGDYVPARISDDATIVYQGGAGLRFDATDWLTVGLDYRYVKSVGEAKFFVYRLQPETHFDAKYDAQTVMLTANWYFFRPPAPVAPAAPPPVVVAPPPPDSDGDGVIDDLDKCPGTPHGTPVDDVGCPLPPPPPPCKAPLPGERVSLSGCATGDVIVLRGVNFDFDKATLTPNAKQILDNVGDELVAYPQINVELGGHTDSKGTHAYNMKLSDRRAASVVKYLKTRGVDGSRMTSKGYGETQPVADNATDEGREMNRRVELKIVGSSADGTMAVGGSSANPSDSASPAPSPADAPSGLQAMPDAGSTPDEATPPATP